MAEEVPPPRQRVVDFACDGCGLCLAACPSNALSEGRVDAERCRDYRRTIEPGSFRYCGQCMRACPQRRTQPA